VCENHACMPGEPHIYLWGYQGTLLMHVISTTSIPWIYLDHISCTFSFLYITDIKERNCILIPHWAQ
jgi:hypothetical protein